MELTEIKAYLKIDSTAEDALISALLSAAESFVQQTTGKTLKGTADINTDDLYNLCVKLMVAHWFENRAVQTSTALNDFSFSVQALINHISLCGDYK